MDTNYISVLQQTLSSSEQAQARQNIGAVSSGEAFPSTASASAGDVLMIDSNGDAVWSNALSGLETRLAAI